MIGWGKVCAAIAMFVLCASQTNAQTKPDTATEIATYLDQTLKPLIAKKQIPGAVVAVVQTGKPTVFLSYGYADIAARRPMNPQTTQVRVGSISKSFTALSLLQLIDEGKVRLNADANLFLKSARIASRFNKPISVFDLLTHRAGFDGDISHVAVDQGQSTAIPPGWMSRQMIRVSPSQRFAYDNTAYAALGQIIADQDGMAYERAVKQRVYDRLGMNQSMMHFDINSPNVATCYQRLKGKFVACKHQLLKDTYAAAGNMSTTAADMARYIEALLGGGKTLLKPETFKAFSNTRNRLHPLGPGVGLGVYEMGAKGSGVFGHSGGIRGGSSMYFVIPSKAIGVFLHINATDGSDMRMNLSGLLSLATSSNSADDDVSPGELTSMIWPTLLAERFGNPRRSEPYSGKCDESQLLGTYQYSRVLGFAALAPRLLGGVAIPPLEVTKSQNDNWTIEGKPYRLSGNCYFTSTTKTRSDGDITSDVGFAIFSDGTVMGGGHPLAGWTKLKWYENTNIVGLPFIAALVLLPFAFMGAWQADVPARKAVRLIAGSGFLLLFCILLEMEFASNLVQNQGQLFPALLWRIGWHVALIGLAIGVVRAFQTFKSSPINLGRKAFIGIMALAGFIAIVLSGYWGLIGTFTGNNFS